MNFFQGALPSAAKHQVYVGVFDNDVSPVIFAGLLSSLNGSSDADGLYAHLLHASDTLSLPLYLRFVRS